MKFNFEKKESVPVIETVRAALFHRGKFLVLQNDKDSKNPAALEFPGGKIDTIQGTSSTLDEQAHTLAEEVQQETHIDVAALPMERIEDYGVYFEITSPDGTVKKYKRLVHLFLIRLPDEEDFAPNVNQTQNEQGEPEDKHGGYRWVSPEELISLTTELTENPETQKQAYPLAKNSRHIKKLLTAVGHLK